MSVIKNLSVSFLFKFFSYVLGPLSLVFIVKPLSVEEYGIYSLINVSISFLLVFLGLGLHRYNFKNIPGKNIDEKYSIIKSVLFFQILFIFIINAVLYYFFLYLLPSDYSKAVIYIILLIDSTYFVREISRFLGLLKLISKKVFISFFMDRLWLIALIYLFYKMKINLYNIIFLRFIFAITALLLSFKFLDFSLLKKAKINKNIIVEALKFGFPLIIVDLGINILEIGDRYILKFFYGNEVIGYYSFAYKWIRIIYSFGSLILFVMQPYISEIYNLEGLKGTKMKFLIKIILKYTFIILVSGLIYFIINFEQLVYLLAKPDYLIVYKIVFLLSPFPIFTVLAYFSQYLLILKGKNKLIMKYYIQASVLNLLLNIILIPHFGAAGAAIATTISYIYIYIKNVKHLEKEFFLSNIYNLNWVEIIKIVLVFLIINICGLFLNFSIIIKTLIYALIYLFFFYKFNIINDKEVSFIKKLN